MRFAVDGMTCGHCVRTITRTLQAIDPDARVDVDLAAGTVFVPDGPIEASQAIATLAAEGYPARLLT